MKHSRNDYNRIQDPLNLIPENEPVFLLRGQDALAIPLLVRYTEGLITNGGDTPETKELVDSIESHINKVRQWQQEHGAKNCDIPTEYEQKQTLERNGQVAFTNEAFEQSYNSSLFEIEKLKEQLDELRMTNKVLVELIELKKTETEQKFRNGQPV